MSFAKTLRVTAPVRFSSHEFWSLILNDTGVSVGTSVNVISYLSGGTACSGVAAKFRQLGWTCVGPTPPRQVCAGEGRSERRVVDPRNTMRTVATVEWAGDEGDLSQADTVRATIAMMARTGPSIRPGYSSPGRKFLRASAKPSRR